MKGFHERGLQSADFDCHYSIASQDLPQAEACATSCSAKHGKMERFGKK